MNRELHTNYASILSRRGEEEVVVAELKMVAMSEDTQKTKVAELFLFRSGAWSMKYPWISCGNDDEHWELPSDWTTSSIFPVSNRIL